MKPKNLKLDRVREKTAIVGWSKEQIRKKINEYFKEDGFIEEIKATHEFLEVTLLRARKKEERKDFNPSRRCVNES